MSWRRHEGAANARHLRGATGHAREIGIRVDDLPRKRARLMEARVVATVGIDRATKRIDPVVSKSPQGSPAEDERYDRMSVLDALERFDAGAPARLRPQRDRELQL